MRRARRLLLTTRAPATARTCRHPNIFMVERPCPRSGAALSLLRRQQVLHLCLLIRVEAAPRKLHMTMGRRRRWHMRGRSCQCCPRERASPSSKNSTGKNKPAIQVSLFADSFLQTFLDCLAPNRYGQPIEKAHEIPPLWFLDIVSRYSVRVFRNNSRQKERERGRNAKREREGARAERARMRTFCPRPASVLLQRRLPKRVLCTTRNIPILIHFNPPTCAEQHTKISHHLGSRTKQFHICSRNFLQNSAAYTTIAGRHPELQIAKQNHW